MKHPTELHAWKALDVLAETRFMAYRAPFSTRSACRLSPRGIGITLDYSTQHLDAETTNALLNLADNSGLSAQINALFSGKGLNAGRGKPALHTALRSPETKGLFVDGQDILPGIHAARQKMREIADAIRAGRWKGVTGKPIRDVVHLGIGGSDLGPRFAIHALAEPMSPARAHFVSDTDPEGFARVVAVIDPETTLFIVASKSFTTAETLHNARKALAFAGGRHALEQHFIAITACCARAREWGFTNILPLWDWVGGRYSFCSAINLITAIVCGFEVFEALLRGAHAMDRHFHEAPMLENLPVMLALSGIWNINFLHHHTLLILTHAHALQKFVPLVQQIDMESNGKSIDLTGRPIHYATGPIVWGGCGNAARHSYFQLLAQGTHHIHGEFLSVAAPELAEVNALCEHALKVLGGGVPHSENTEGFIPGGFPLNHLILRDRSPETLGALVALYEHKVFVQSVIWNINPFTQPGVESAKSVAALGGREELSVTGG